MRLDAGVLHDILGVGGIAGQPAGKRQRVAEMRQHHLVEAFRQGPLAQSSTMIRYSGPCRLKMRRRPCPARGGKPPETGKAACLAESEFICVTSVKRHGGEPD